MTKPAPIHIGVSGFTAFLAESEPTNQATIIDWAYLLGLPPFEMYLSEKTGNQDRQAWKDWLEQEIIAKGDDTAYLDYATWHAEKGYWVGETPMGELIGDDYAT